MTIVTLPLYKTPPEPPPGVPLAAFGVRDTIPSTHNLILLALPNQHTTITEKVFTLDVELGASQYGWFYVRADLSPVRFLDLATSLYGGWDGANWPYGDIGTENGPKIVMNGSEVWHLYRTDFSGIGKRNFKVMYA